MARRFALVALAAMLSPLLPVLAPVASASEQPNPGTEQLLVYRAPSNGTNDGWFADPAVASPSARLASAGFGNDLISNVAISFDGLRVAGVMEQKSNGQPTRRLVVAPTAGPLSSARAFDAPAGSTFGQEISGSYQPNIAFSPVSNAIAVFAAATGNDGNLELFPASLIESGTGTPSRVTTFRGKPDHDPVWSPDGTWIALSNDNKVVVGRSGWWVRENSDRRGAPFAWDSQGRIWWLDDMYVKRAAAFSSDKGTKLADAKDWGFKKIWDINLLPDGQTLAVVGQASDDSNRRAFVNTNTWAVTTKPYLGDRESYVRVARQAFFGFESGLPPFVGSGNAQVLEDGSPTGKFLRLTSGATATLNSPTALHASLGGSIAAVSRSAGAGGLVWVVTGPQGSMSTTTPASTEWSPVEAPLAVADRGEWIDASTGVAPTETAFTQYVQNANALSLTSDGADVDEIYISLEKTTAKFLSDANILTSVPVDHLPAGQASSPAVQTAPVRLNIVDLAPVRLNIVDLAPVRLNIVDLAPVRLNIVDLAPVRLNIVDLAPLVVDGFKSVSLGTLPHSGGCWNEIATILDAPVQSLSLYDALVLEPRPACLTNTTLGELDLSGSVLGSITLDAILLGGVPLSALNIPDLCDRLEGAGFPDCGSGFGGGDATMVEAIIAGVPQDRDGTGNGLPDLSEMTMGELRQAASDAAVFSMKLPSAGALRTSSLGSIRYSEIDNPDSVFDCAGGCDQNANLYELSGKIRPNATFRDLAGSGLSARNISEVGLSLVGLDARPTTDLKFSESGIAGYGEPIVASFAAQVGQTTTQPRLTVAVRDGLDILSATVSSAAGPVPAEFSLESGVLTVAPTGINHRSGAPDDTLNRGDTVEFRIAFAPPLDAGPVLWDAKVSSPQRNAAFPDSSLAVNDPTEPNDTAETAYACGTGRLWVGEVHGNDIDYCVTDVDAEQTATISLNPGTTDLDLVVYHDEGSEPGEPLRAIRRPDPRVVPVSDTVARFAAVGGLPTESRHDVPLLGTRIVAGQSAHVDDSTESVVINKPGRYLLQVSKAATAADSDEPYMLKIATSSAPAGEPTNPPATEIPSLSTTVGTAASAATKTLFLVASGRLQNLYGAGPTAELLGGLNAIATRPEVSGLVWHVDADPAVRSAYANFDANISSPTAANAVVRAINDLVSGRLDSGGPGSTENIVLVGGDRVIPFARLHDGTLKGSETGFADSVSDDPALSGAFGARRILSDDPYGEFDPIPWQDRYLYVSDVAVGRVVESPAEILAQISQYTENNGHLDTQSVMTVGSDFMKDVSSKQDQRSELVTGKSQPDFISDSFTKQQLLTAAGNGVDLVNLNVHADPTRIQTGSGDTVTANEFSAAANSLWFGLSMGCHTGVNRLDAIAVGPVADWAQSTTSSDGAGWIGQTGYGFGSSATITLSEWVVDRTHQYLTSGVTTGDALKRAKQDYLARQGVYDVYDERVVQQTVLFGFPFWEVVVASGAGPAETQGPELVDGVDPATGLNTSSVTLSPTHTEVQTSSGTYFTDPVFGSTETIDRPIEPVYGPIDVTRDQRAHGAVVTSLRTRDIEGHVPARLTPELSGGITLAGVNGDGVFPEAPQNLFRTSGPDSEIDNLTVITGQYLPPGTAASVSVQRLIESIGVTVLYSDSDDFVPPSIDGVSLGLASEVGHLKLTVSATDASTVKRVVACVVDGSGTWSCPDLVNQNGSFSRDIPVSGSRFRLCIQAIDGAGNVAINCLKASDLLPGLSPAPPVEGVVQPVIEAGGQASGYVRNADVTFERSDPNILVGYSLDGSETRGWDGEPIAIPNTDGVHTVDWTASNGQSDSVSVNVDATPPSVEVEGLTEGARFRRGEQVTVNVSCTDAASGVDVCVTEQPVDTSTEGMKTFVVLGRDNVGNETRRAIHYTVDFDPRERFAPAEATVNGEQLADGWWKSARVHIQSDPQVTVRYSVDGGLSHTYNSDILVPPFDGPHTIAFDELWEGAIFRSGSITVKIDTSAPNISVARPTEGQRLVLKSDVSPSFECADPAGGSGLATCTSGGLTTSSVGPKQFRVDSTDRAGLSSSAVRNYQVVYAPLDFGGEIAEDGYYYVPAGSTKTMAIKALDALGANRTNEQTVQSVQRTNVPCPSGNAKSVSYLLTGVGSSWGKYSDYHGDYRYTMYTPATAGGTCTRLAFTLDDQTTRSLTFKH